MQIGRGPRLASLALMLAGLVAACGNHDVTSDPTSPQAMFVRTVDRTLVLQTVRVHGDIDPGSGAPGVPAGAFDADVDLGDAEVRIVARSEHAGVVPLELVVADGVWWTRAVTGWQRQGGGGMIPMPAGEDVRTALTALATDSRITVSATEIVCAGRPCHRLTAVVPPEVGWERFASILRSLPLVAVPEEPPADLPVVRIVVDADAVTFDPMRVEITTGLASDPMRLVLVGSGHDQPLDIRPPRG